MNMLKELTDSEKFDITMPLMEAIEMAIFELIDNEPLEEGLSHADRLKKRSNSNFKKFFNSNRQLVQDASVIAVSNFNDWNKNSRKTITLHAKDAHERRTIGDIVDTLVKTNKFKVYKTKFHMGRKIWILRKR